MTENHGIENFEEPKAIARHEIKCTLDDVIREAAKFKTRWKILYGSQTKTFGRNYESYECVQNRT